MKNIDWICAETGEQAKQFYKNEVGYEEDEINEDFEGEVSLQQKMFVPFEDLSPKEQKQNNKKEQQELSLQKCHLNG